MSYIWINWNLSDRTILMKEHFPTDFQPLVVDESDKCWQPTCFEYWHIVSISRYSVHLSITSAHIEKLIGMTIKHSRHILWKLICNTRSMFACKPPHSTVLISYERRKKKMQTKTQLTHANVIILLLCIATMSILFVILWTAMTLFAYSSRIRIE